MKRGKVSAFTLVMGLMVFLAVAHIGVHSFFFGFGLADLNPSGLAIGDLNFDNLAESYNQMSGLSRAIIISEWTLISIIVFTAVVRRINSGIKMKKDVGDLNLKAYHRSNNMTDIDVLHDVLKDKKHLRVSSISKLFDIEYNLALKWGRILEEGELAKLKYPMFGEPEVIVSEGVVKTNEQ